MLRLGEASSPIRVINIKVMLILVGKVQCAIRLNGVRSSGCATDSNPLGLHNLRAQALKSPRGRSNRLEGALGALLLIHALQVRLNGTHGRIGSLRLAYAPSKGVRRVQVVAHEVHDFFQGRLFRRIHNRSPLLMTLYRGSPFWRQAIFLFFKIIFISERKAFYITLIYCELHSPLN